MFNVIAGSGHCGTKWLSHVLDQRPGWTWYHHAREKISGLQWHRADLLDPADEVFDRYWRWLESELEKGDVGDANSWPPHLIPAMNGVHKVDRVIYLTRNKVQQLHSLSTTSPFLSRDPLVGAARIKCRTLYDIMPEKPDKPYETWTRFERLCLMVAANDFMPDYLREHGLEVDEYDLEDLTTDVEMLAELVPELDEEELKEWQGRDINRKVEGSRAKTTIWRSWTAEQRAAYKMVIGDA